MGKRGPIKSRNKSQSSLLVVKDKKTGDLLPVCFLDGPAEYVNEMFAKGPSKTAYGEAMTRLMAQSEMIGGSITENELDKTTPVSEEQLKFIFPHASAMQTNDPLTQVDKTRIHDNIRRDGATKRAILTIAYFMMPEPPVLTLGLNRKYATKQRELEHLSEIQNNPEYLDIIEEIMNRDDDLDMYSREVELIFSAEAYGRAVQVRQYDTSGFPKRYIPLSSPRLGRNYVDRRTGEFLGVEYKDYPTDKRILLANDILHYEVDDFGITPGSRYYGMASAEASMSIGERNRSANEIAIPEIMKRMFAPMMLVKNKAKGAAKLAQIRDAWKSGKTVFYNNDIEISVVSIPHDLEKIRQAVDQGAQEIFRSFTVPIGVGWPSEQNRATFEGSVLQWYQSVLAFKRSHFANVMWRQHYKPQLVLTYENRLTARLMLEGGVYNYITQKAANPSQSMLPFRINMEFKDVKTVGFLDLAAALAQFGDRGYLSPDLIRNESGLGKYNDEMAEYDIAKVKAAPTFTSTDNAMTMGTVNESIPNVKDLANQSNSQFNKGLPSPTNNRDYSE